MSDAYIAVDTFKATVDAPDYHYRGLAILAYPGVHEAVGALAAAERPAGAAILDIAAGSGALCLRLRDAGFAMTACDLVTDNFKLHESVPFRTVELNTRFGETLGQSFDAITAVEIIEHLENPRQFIRQCAALLEPGGKLILTTPNIDSGYSRALRLRAGHPNWFDERTYRDGGHITPISVMTLKRILAEAGFTLILLTSAGERHIPAHWWKFRLLAALLRLLDASKTPQKETLIAVAVKGQRGKD